MKLSFRNAALPFGQTIKTTFIDAEENRVDSVYSFITGPSATIERTNGPLIINGVWKVSFDEPARIHFERGVYHFNSGTVVQTGSSYEMFVTVLFKASTGGDCLIYSVNEL
ncbi:hypothetical protein [Leclercia adecarboxylata]|uniref:hypothetical protein n=1 Tax=Leclercia adecarboxylata TaxID=83655 RepID=UPI0011DF3E9A|nr:hypothetical protein [Leclercia adecarboxylata]NEG91074.1 hypothetical protein [Leclercia adecarboxylata]